MYPPQTQYSQLAQDPEGADTLFPPQKTLFSRLRPWLRPILIGGTALFFVSLVVHLSGSTKNIRIPFTRPAVEFPNNNSFAFDNPRPSWLTSAPTTPLGLRVAVVSRADEFERRQALRESVFAGVHPEDVDLAYRFFVGAPTGDSKSTTDELNSERARHGDVIVLSKIADIPERLSEKRYAALQWSGSVSHESYDYFMTIDSDTFVRLGALARRMPSFLSDKNVTNPREQPVLIGRMGSHLTYFLNTVKDGNEDPSEEDTILKGPWFSYPAGIGYMLSSSLVKTLLSTTPALPHHIHYPSDDVMIGSWIAALKHFPDPSIEFESTDHSPEPIHRVIPEPFLSESVDTAVLDDVEGWHDFIERGGHDASFSWSSVCVHHVTGEEMRAFRAMEGIKGEWKS